MLVPRTAVRILAPLRGLGKRLVAVVPGLKYDLLEAEVDLEVEDYLAASLVSSGIWGALLFGIGLFTLGARVEGARVLPLAIAMGLGAFLIFLVLHVYYPKIMAGKLAERVDRDLVFALKELLVNVESGVPLFDAMNSVATSNYGQVSKEFGQVVKEITSGYSEDAALRRLALRSDSEYLKRAVWQMLTAIKAGSSLGAALRNVIDTLLAQQYRAIKQYAAELNFLILMYMLLAAVLPTIGITLIILLSAFGNIDVTPQMLIAFVSVSVVAQVALIGLIRSRRPVLRV